MHSIPKPCKGMHCVDLGESFPTSIYLQKSASIQPRTSLSKFGGKFNSLLIRLLRHLRPAGQRSSAGNCRYKEKLCTIHSASPSHFGRLWSRSDVENMICVSQARLLIRSDQKASVFHIRLLIFFADLPFSCELN